MYIQNRIGDKVSAYEQYFGTKPNLWHYESSRAEAIRKNRVDKQMEA
jgi:hypothetical protein